jgi:hypothetical protein
MQIKMAMVYARLKRSMTCLGLMFTQVRSAAMFILVSCNTHVFLFMLRIVYTAVIDVKFKMVVYVKFKKVNDLSGVVYASTLGRHVCFGMTS